MNNHLVILFTAWKVNRQCVPRQLMHPYLYLHPTTQVPGICWKQFPAFFLSLQLQPELHLPAMPPFTTAEIMKEAACETFQR